MEVLTNTALPPASSPLAACTRIRLDPLQGAGRPSRGEGQLRSALDGVGCGLWGTNSANGDPSGIGSTNVTARTFGFAAGMD